jgi:hypothetical protein
MRSEMTAVEASSILKLRPIVTDHPEIWIDTKRDPTSFHLEGQTDVPSILLRDFDRLNVSLEDLPKFCSKLFLD